MRMVLMFFLGLALGALLGAYFFIDVRARTFVAPAHCSEHCINAKELGGLLVSIGIQKTPDLLPSVIEETDKTVALKSPEPLAKIDYLILPKKDILDLGDLSIEDSAYVADAFEVMADLVRTKGLTDYKVITNGPGFQQVRYLHFHLLAQ